MTNLAPIILFVYNRPEHTLRCLNSLSENTLANQSVLHIFCDGPKADASFEDLQKVDEVKSIVQSKKWCNEVVFHFRSENIGLRNSVISGVSSVINQQGKVIVIEDDLVLSPHFLSYMNEGLNRYEQYEGVGQISGFSFSLATKDLREDAYFLPLTTTWGWATWKRVWNDVDFDGKKAGEILDRSDSIKAFNLNHSFGYYEMLQKQLNADKGISSWGIMFWLNAFSRKFLVLYPKHSLVLNNGFDGSGRHKANEQTREDIFIDELFEVKNFPHEIKSNEGLFKLLQTKLRKQEYSFKKRLFRLLKKIKG